MTDEQLFDSIATNIKRLREQADVSQAELARTAGVDQGTLNRLEGRKAKPDLYSLNLIAQALGVAISDLLSDVEKPLGGMRSIAMRKIAGHLRGLTDRDAMAIAGIVQSICEIKQRAHSRASE